MASQGHHAAILTRAKPVFYEKRLNQALAHPFLLGSAPIAMMDHAHFQHSVHDSVSYRTQVNRGLMINRNILLKKSYFFVILRKNHKSTE
jgi:hypothetical protein